MRVRVGELHRHGRNSWEGGDLVVVVVDDYDGMLLVHHCHLRATWVKAHIWMGCMAHPVNVLL